MRVVQMLRHGEAHTGLIYESTQEPVFDTSDLVREVLLEEPYQVMVSAVGEWAKHERLDFAELSAVPWLCSWNGDEASDRVLKRVTRSLGYPLRQLMRTDDPQMIHGLVEEGLGFALTTASAVNIDFGVALRPSVQDLGSRRVSFVRPIDNAPAAAEWLGDAVRSVAAEPLRFQPRG